MFSLAKEMIENRDWWKKMRHSEGYKEKVRAKWKTMTNQKIPTTRQTGRKNQKLNWVDIAVPDCVEI